MDKLKFILIFIYYISIKKCQYVKLEKEMSEQIQTYLIYCKKGLLIQGSKNKVKNPKISVVIPMFNEEKHLLLALRSVQNQSLRDLEIICVNDKSTDNSLKLLKKLKKEDPRIKIIINIKLIL